MDPPTGTVTFLFTDIVESTEQWETDRKWMREALRCHNEAIRSAIAARRGLIFKETGDGFCAAFTSVPQAVGAAIEAHRKLQTASWPSDQRLRVRMAIHTGATDYHDGDYFGPTVNRVARLLSVAASNQVVLSDAAKRSIAQGKAEGATTHYLGSFRLKGLATPLRAYLIKHQDLPAGSESDWGFATKRKPRHNILADERPFIGRQSELANLRHRFLVEKQRLVTLTAMGGMGKTRLAREFARQIAGDFPDGAWFVECESLKTRDDIASMILATLNVEAREASPESALIKHLAKKRMLIVLDCFEGVAQHAALVEETLRNCPSVSMLITSRTVLGLQREHEVPLRPMTDEGGLPMDDAISLFVEGARHVVDGFELTRRNRRIVSQIVARLEAVPLCIVLASSRLRYVSLEELQESLETERLQVLRRKGIADDKHARLIDVIEGSLAFLGQSVAQLFFELSVFAGGFTRKDAEAVCGRDVADGLESLRDHSLIVLVPSKDRTRYKMLDTLREFAMSRLSEESRLTLAERHTERFAEVAKLIRDASERGNWEQASELLRAELGNLRSGVAFAVVNQMDEAIRTYAFALCRSFFEAGFWSEFETLSRAAAEVATRLADDDLAIMALGLRGAMERRRGNETAATRIWKQRLELCLNANRHEQTADTLIDLSIQAREREEMDSAAKYLNQAKQVAESIRSTEVLATVRIAEINLLMAQGSIEDAREIAYELARFAPDPAKVDYWLYVFGSLGPVFLRLGEPKMSIEVLTTSLRLALEADRLFAAGFSLIHLGRAYDSVERLDSAYRAFLAGMKLHSELRSKLRAESAKELRRIRKRLAKADPALEATSWRELCAQLTSGPAQ